MRQTRFLARASLAALLCSTGLSKLVWPDTGQGHGWSFAVGALEMVFAAVCVFSARHANKACLACIVLASAGGTLALLVAGPCGCMGRLVELGSKERLLLAGSMGFLAVLGLDLGQRPARE